MEVMDLALRLEDRSNFSLSMSFPCEEDFRIHCYGGWTESPNFYGLQAKHKRKTFLWDTGSACLLHAIAVTLLFLL